MRCCKLSQNEAVRLERDGTLPSCRDHLHCSFVEAFELVESDIQRWVTSDSTSKRRITPTTVISYWSARPSVIRYNKQVLGVISTMQAVVR